MGIPFVTQKTIRSEYNGSLRRQVIPVILSLVFFSFLINILALTLPIYMMQVFDRVVPTQHLETLFYLTLIAGVAILVHGILDIIRSRILIRTGTWMSNIIKPKLLRACITSKASGLDVGSRPLEELDMLKAILAGPAATALFDIPWFPVFIAVIWLVHPVLGLAALGAALILLFLSGLSHFLMQRKTSYIRNLVQRGDRFGSAAIQGSSSILGMRMWPDILQAWKTLRSDPAEESGAQEEVIATFSAAIKSIRLFVQVSLLGIGAYLAVQGEITMGSVIAVSILSGRALAPVDILVSSWKQILHAREATHFLRQLLARNPELKMALQLPPPSGKLEVQNISVVTPGGSRLLLNQISFSLAAGDSLAIIGASGAGKSSLCKALIGYFQLANGHIRLDGADIGRWRDDDLSPHIGYLPQKVEFFPGSVKKNIARFQESPDHDVIEAAKLAGLHELILALPKGYETQIETDGSPLSGGQAQRIALARTLFRKPSLIVLDEPNANLDGAGAAALITALNAASDWGATLLIVAHRQDMLQGIGKILALRDGRIELFGPANLVLEKLAKASSPMNKNKRDGNDTGENSDS